MSADALRELECRRKFLELLDIDLSVIQRPRNSHVSVTDFHR
jgi:hypothetical protein